LGTWPSAGGRLSWRFSPPDASFRSPPATCPGTLDPLDAKGIQTRRMGTILHPTSARQTSGDPAQEATKHQHTWQVNGMPP